MFKKTQNYLLLHHPLLWNTKFIPVIIITLIINILFFAGGYLTGAVDFNDPHNLDEYSHYEPMTIFLNLIISLLVIILWLTFYFRNNGFKSLYPKKNNSLYKEWLIILTVCLLNFSNTAIYEYAFDLRARNYYSKEEVIKRTNLLSRASIFVDGSFYHWSRFDRTQYNELLYSLENNNLRYKYKEYNEEEVVIPEVEPVPEVYDEEEVVIPEIEPVPEVYNGGNKKNKGKELYNPEWDTVCYFGNQYPITSLINKQNLKFSIQENINDSINEWKVKTWMLNREKDSIKKLLDDFFVLVNEHNLQANITSKQWFDFVYKPNDYNDYQIVGNDEFNVINDDRKSRNNKEYKPKNDLENNRLEKSENTAIPFAKYYVPLKRMENAYDRISGAYVSPIDFKDILGIIYFTFIASLVIFSFRISSVKNWFISVISLGIMGLITFIFSFIITYSLTEYYDSSQPVTFITIWAVILIVSLIYFVYINRQKTSKKLSGIVANILLWILPFTLIMVYFYLYTYYDATAIRDINGSRIYEMTGLEKIIHNNILDFFYINLAFILLYMYPFTKLIKKWKGIAEA